MLPALLRFFAAEPPRVLEYWYDNSMLSGWKKPPRPFALDRAGMARDIAEYRAMGFADIATFACFLGEDYRALYGDVDIRPFADLCG